MISRGQVLAHRGWWTDPGDKNSLAAFQRAFRSGFGIETDLRDAQGAIVVSHDPPVGTEHVSFDQLLELYCISGQPGTLALNIKSDGLAALVAASLNKYDVSNYFCFDMSVPDAVGYIRAGLTVYTRISDFEPNPAFYSAARGVWVDSFEGGFPTDEQLRLLVSDGKILSFVSPELHGRPVAEFPSVALPFIDTGAYLCTDLPGTVSHFSETILEEKLA